LTGADRAEPDAVAAGDDVALVGDQALEQPADGAADLSAVLGLDDALKPVDAQHPPREGNRLVHRGHGGGGLAVGGGFGRLVLDDGAVPGEVALGADALAADGGLVLEAVPL